MNLPSSYTWQARLIPAVVLLLPPVVLLSATSVISSNWLGRLAPLGIWAALSTIVAQAVRQRGLQVQERLWAASGGSPTRRMLRVQDGRVDGEVATRRERLAAVTNERLPTTAEERHDHEAAEQAYERAEARLRNLSRDRDRFGLLFDENRNYGMRRNLLGVRGPATTLAMLTVLASAIGFLFAQGSTSHRLMDWLLPGVISLAALTWWRVAVTADWVEQAGQLYAKRFFEAVDTLYHEHGSSA